MAEIVQQAADGLRTDRRDDLVDRVGGLPRAIVVRHRKTGRPLIVALDPDRPPAPAWPIVQPELGNDVGHLVAHLGVGPTGQSASMFSLWRWCAPARRTVHPVNRLQLNLANAGEHWRWPAAGCAAAGDDGFCRQDARLAITESGMRRSRSSRSWLHSPHQVPPRGPFQVDTMKRSRSEPGQPDGHLIHGRGCRSRPPTQQVLRRLRRSPGWRRKSAGCSQCRQGPGRSGA